MNSNRKGNADRPIDAAQTDHGIESGDSYRPHGDTKQGQTRNQPVEQTPDVEIEEAQRADQQGEPGKRDKPQEDDRPAEIVDPVENPKEIRADEDFDTDEDNEMLDEQNPGTAKRGEERPRP